MENAPNNPRAEGSAGGPCNSDTQGDLFGMTAEPLAATLPTRGTLAFELFELLVAGERMTQPEWLPRTRSWRLAATVGQLGELGWPVQSLLVPAPSERNPHRKIARYYLAAEAIAAGRALCGKVKP